MCLVVNRSCHAHSVATLGVSCRRPRRRFTRVIPSKTVFRSEFAGASCAATDLGAPDGAGSSNAGCRLRQTASRPQG